MSITDFIEEVCVQTAVYWSAPVSDGLGGFTYDDPIEIKCRWQGTTRVVTDSKGKQIVCVAELLVTQDLEVDGLLFLGTLDDIDLDYLFKPELVEGTVSIKRIDKTPLIKSEDEFVRKVYL